MRPQVEALLAVMRSHDRLDDVTRARIWARLSARIAAPRRRSKRARALAGGALAIAAAAAVLVVVRTPASTGASEVVALTAPAKGILVAPLGPHADATLVGPARVVVDAIGEHTTVRLVEGMLVSEFHGGPGRALRIEAAGATIEVVGTLFAVEVHGDVACVSVAHGHVRVTAGARVLEVTNAQRTCVTGGVPGPIEPIDATTREALDRRSPPIVPVVPVVPSPPPPPLPPPPPRTIERPHVAPPPPDHHADAPPDAPLPPIATGPDADALYADADAALARGDRDAADRALGRLVAQVPTSPLVDEALFERARIAFDRRAWTVARRFLDQLAARPSTALREPGGYLRCRVAVAAAEHDAAACLVTYRASFPNGPHDLDAGAMLVALTYKAGGCDAARIPIADLARAYPKSSEVRAWQSRCGAPP